jgi:D-3-phosphoglycerate dehydrogenase
VDTALNYDSLLSVIPQYDALVVRSKIIIDRPFLDHARHLRCIGRVGAGMETIDVDYAESLGIRCLNSPEGNRDAVGEHAVGLLLALLCNIARADAEVRRGLWQREANRGLELGSLTVGIVGYGNMGQAFAKRLAGFGCRVVIYDKYKEIGSLEEVQREADVVSFHVPLTDETRHYLSAGFIETMAKPFFVVNTARGAVVDTEALVQGLQSGKVRGAALDVLEYENMQADGLGEVPAPMRYLMQSPQTVLTPHVAGWTVESKYRLAAVLADKMIDVLK